ncbi:MAG: hypothetical protein EA412_05860, partial [Chitinophagaceae bacterium]
MIKKYFLLTNFIFLISLFCLNLQAQSVTIVQPNGGETLYSCEVYPITWNQSGSLSNYWNIDYSLDGGTIWASVASNFQSTTGEYLWTVPNVSSTTVLIRVRDAQNLSTQDISDSLFSINFPIQITSPVGGEVWQGLSTQQITWDAGGTSNTYQIHYSKNGGNTWIPIVTNYSSLTGTYDWTVPNDPGSNVIVRVRDAAQYCKQDISNVFEITPAQPVLLTPNGGEELWPGCSYQITWDQETFYSNVRLEYSDDNGVTWNTAFSSTSNNGSRNWTPPANIIPGNQYLIKASNTADFNVFDVSDAPFTILEPIEIINPMAGDTVYGCNLLAIEMIKSTCIGNFRVLYSLDNGATWSTIITSLSNTSNNNQIYENWTIPNGITTDEAIIRVERAFDNTVFAESEVFSIRPSNDITVTAPTPGESINASTTYQITWDNTPNVSGAYDLHYKTVSSGWTTIATNITGNAYNWNVPNMSASTVQIRVRDRNNTCKANITENFTIIPDQPILLGPNGGEEFWPGCSYPITWDASTFYTNPTIQYSSDSGSTWTTIWSTSTNNGSRNWGVPIGATPGDNYLIKIFNSGNSTLHDVSDAPFTIKTPLTVIEPDETDTLIGCTTFPIRFETSGCIGSLRISYSIDGGDNWTVIVSSLSNSTSGMRTYNWSVPNGINTDEAKIRVERAFDSSVFHESELFSIRPSDEIDVLTPTAGESVPALQPYEITWNHTPVVSEFEIHYSINDGGVWNLIDNNVSGTSFTWEPPNTPTSTARIRVRDRFNYCRHEVSDAFTITPAQPVLLTPNGGEELWPGCSYQITWDQETFYSNVRL